MTSTLTRRLPPLPTVRDIMRIYGIKSKKKLSQNFLLDPRALNKLVLTTGPLEGKYVVEVGPGPGGLTRAILGNGAREVHVIEKDQRFLPSLKLLQEVTGNTLHINMGDALHYNMCKIFPDSLRTPWDTQSIPDIRLMGNLPFNITTPLLMRLLRSMADQSNIFSYGRVPIVLTFQQEAAERMIAAPDDPQRSRLSVMCQNYASIKYKYTLPGGAFEPAPTIDVAVVTMTPLRRPYIDLPFAFVERVVTTLFQGKRKEIKNTVRNLFPASMRQQRNTYQLLKIADIAYNRQAIGLNMDEIEKICYAYKDMCDQDPDIQNFIKSEVRVETLAYQEEHLLYLDKSEE